MILTAEDVEAREMKKELDCLTESIIGAAIAVQRERDLGFWNQPMKRVWRMNWADEGSESNVRRYFQ